MLPNEGQPQQDVCVLCSGQGFQEMNGVRVPCSCAESQPQQDAPIPERWKEAFENAEIGSERYGDSVTGGEYRMRMKLIREVGRAEAALTQAREAFEEACKAVCADCADKELVWLDDETKQWVHWFDPTDRASGRLGRCLAHEIRVRAALAATQPKEG